MEIFSFFHNVENFGNGRFVDKILQEILVKHSLNENLLQNIDTIMIEDIPTIADMVEKTFNNRENVVIPSDVTDDERKRTAIHELGHAIITYIYTGEISIRKITVIPEGTGALGYVLHTDPKAKATHSKRDYLNSVEISLAGRAAEEIFYGDGNAEEGCWNDLEKASVLLKKVLTDYGMSETLGLMSGRSIKLSLEMQQKIDAEIKKTLDDCYANVKKVLKDNLKMFNKVLDKLMEKGTITGEEFAKLVK